MDFRLAWNIFEIQVCTIKVPGIVNGPTSGEEFNIDMHACIYRKKLRKFSQE